MPIPPPPKCPHPQAWQQGTAGAQPGMPSVTRALPSCAAPAAAVGSARVCQLVTQQLLQAPAVLGVAPGPPVPPSSCSSASWDDAARTKAPTALRCCCDAAEEELL